MSNVRVECVKLTGRLGLRLPDQLFLRFNTRQCFPEGKSEIYSIKKGESWVVSESFEFDQPVSFQLREFDHIGDAPGRFARTPDGDASDHKVTYTLTVS